MSASPAADAGTIHGPPSTAVIARRKATAMDFVVRRNVTPPVRWYSRRYPATTTK